MSMISGVTLIPGLPALRHAVLVCMVLWASLASTSQGQIHGRNGPFDRVARLLRQKQDSRQGATLDLVQTQLLIDTLLQRVDCYSTTNPEVCDWCIPAEMLFRIVGVDPVSGALNEASFGPASVVLLYYLHAPQDTCSPSPSTAGTNDSFPYRDYLLALSGLNSTAAAAPRLGSRISFGEGAIFSEERLQVLIQIVNRTYIPTSKFQCFDAHVLIDEAEIVNDHDIAQAGLETLGAHLVSALLHGHCIGKGTLVAPSYFVDFIFEEYGDNHVINELGFDRLLRNLHLGTLHGIGGSTDTQHTEEPTSGSGNKHIPGPGSSGPNRGGGNQPASGNNRGNNGGQDQGHQGHNHGHHGHSHLVERSISTRGRTTFKSVTSLDNNRWRRELSPDQYNQQNNTKYEQCFSRGQLFDIFGVNEVLGVSEPQFTDLCPAIIHQIMTDACDPTRRATKNPPFELSLAEVYGWGTLSVFIITAASLLGLFILPCLSSKTQEYAIHTFVALSVGTMSGDAFLHLIPEALGLHTHAITQESDFEHDHHKDHDHLVTVEIDTLDVIYKMTAVIGAIYFFFLFETMMNIIFSKKTDHSDTETRRCSRLVEPECEKTSVFNTQADQVWLTEAADANLLPNLPEPSTLTNPIHMNGNNDTEDRGIDNLVEMERDDDDDDGSSFITRGMKPVSVMILLGDALHNSLDGVVIGAAYTSNIFVGVSTSIAVLCHEVPHELGDFGVLIENGMSYSRAVFWNFTSGCTAFIGLYLGIVIGMREGAHEWLFAITAGFFLYISMVDLFGGLLRDGGHGHSHGATPAMKRSPAISNRHSWLQEMELNEQSQRRSKMITFLGQNVGLLAGWAIMFILSYYEEDLLHLKLFMH